ncbi:MAG: hypothetical protein KJO96_00065 [Winogradskyella sp.]|nr:hypothetical protein [Winogradskyella sp.]
MISSNDQHINNKIILFLASSIGFFVVLTYGDWDGFSITKTIIIKLFIALAFAFLLGKVFCTLTKTSDDEDD